MPSLGDILLCAHGTNYVHSAIYLGTPREFLRFTEQLPPEERESIRNQLQEDEMYVIHFAGSNDAEAASQNWVSALTLSMSSTVAAEDGNRDNSVASIRINLFEEEFSDFSQHLVTMQEMETPRSDWDHNSILYAIFDSTTQEANVYSPEETVSRAFSMYGTRFGTYHLLQNNCQHFVTYCKYGRKFLLSTQNKFLAWKSVEIARTVVNLWKGVSNRN